MPDPSFDPRLWLSAFAAIGGGYALTPDRKLWLVVDGYDDEALAACLAPLVGEPERQSAIKAAIEQRQLGEAA
ncbi:hypothetical protein [Sphingomonas sp. ABOLG]|uniref:hypothetical protein n=1 Tax=Sphingomonas sp. ABOLG TaxID=1985880 RepID=UPI001F49C150|nr:hypothetical protein [Sphingomonas sp. ABOLG]